MFEAFLLACTARDLSPGTLRFYRQKLVPFQRWLEANGIAEECVGRDAVVAYLASLTCKRQAPARALRAALRGKVAVPMPKRSPPAAKVLTQAQLQTVLASVNGKTGLLVRFMADSGLRRQETADLEWGDISERRVLVRNGKGNKSRIAFIGERTRDGLAALPLNERTVFGLTAWGVSSAIRRASKKSGIIFGCHDLRRYYATSLTKGGVSAFALQRLMGHSSIETTLLYVRLVDADLEAAYISPADALKGA